MVHEATKAEGIKNSEVLVSKMAEHNPVKPTVISSVGMTIQRIEIAYIDQYLKILRRDCSMYFGSSILSNTTLTAYYLKNVNAVLYIKTYM